MNNDPKIGALTLHDIALADPTLALVLAQAGRGQKGIGVGGSIGVGGDCGATQIGLAGWEVINIGARWDSTAADQLIPAQVTGIVETDLWIRKVVYTVRRPNAFAGSPLKAQSDYYNSLNPCIEVDMTINSFARYIISQNFTPLENFPAAFECVCPAGFVLACSANIQARFRNVRTLQDDEIPTEAVISLHGVRLPPGSYGACQAQNAQALLKELGYL